MPTLTSRRSGGDLRNHPAIIGESAAAGIRLLELMRDLGISRAEAARRAGLTIGKARQQIADATRYLKHPRNKQHPCRPLVVL
jgi:DNA-binding CsgD family transcriptional regulator